MKRQMTARSFIMCLLFCSLVSLPVEAANPGWLGHYFKFKHNGSTYSGNRYFQTRWNPSDTPWDGHFTTAGNKYDHSHAPHGFPFYVMIGEALVEVTVAKSDAAWDEQYAGYTRFGSSTFSQNCHGYSTGYGSWTSMPQILADDYISADEHDAEIWTNGNPHSIKIEGYCPNGCEFDTIAKTSEKNTSSGYYRIEYYCPGGAGRWTNLYKKK